MNSYKGFRKSALLIIILSTLVSGCATLNGMGEDIETAGEAVQDAADG